MAVVRVSCNMLHNEVQLPIRILLWWTILFLPGSRKVLSKYFSGRTEDSERLVSWSDNHIIPLLFRGMLHPVDPEAAPAACTHGAPQHHIPHVPLSAGLQHLVLLERSHLLYRQDRRLLTLQLRVSTLGAMGARGGSGGVAPLIVDVLYLWHVWISWEWAGMAQSV